MQSVRQYKKLNLAGLNACANADAKVRRGKLISPATAFKRATMMAGIVSRQTFIA